MDRPGVEGAKWCCSPPLRDKAAQEAIWAGLANGTFQTYSSDHAPYRFDETGKIRAASRPPSRRWPTACPASRCACRSCFPKACCKGRHRRFNQFVALAATNHARMYGLYPRKGTIAVGSDADIAIWNPDDRKAHRLFDDARRGRLHALRGHVYKGWPIVVSRGRVVVEDGKLKVARGSGQFIARGGRSRCAGHGGPSTDGAKSCGRGSTSMNELVLAVR